MFIILPLPKSKGNARYSTMNSAIPSYFTANLTRIPRHDYS